jgi:hypothetical protein
VPKGGRRRFGRCRIRLVRARDIHTLIGGKPCAGMVLADWCAAFFALGRLFWWVGRRASRYLATYSQGEKCCAG